jgi:uncharacterized protein YdeI (YjbR/CyaY-like superfamily)
MVKSSKAQPADEKPELLVLDQQSWAEWLDKHHLVSGGAWLKIARKASGKSTVSYEEALEVALCYGWIDSQVKGADEYYVRQKFTPRSKKSSWSKRNREKALRLIRAGRMKTAGLAEVERAKRDGRWRAAYDPPSRIKVPADFKAALTRHAQARSFFEGLDSRNRYAILFRLHTAKKAETRARRIQQFVEMLKKKLKLHP